MAHRKKFPLPCLPLLLFIPILFLAACRTKELQINKQKRDSYTVGVVTKSGTSEYWMTVQRGMEVAAGELEMDLIFLSPDSETNEEAQLKMVRTLLKRNVDVIAISPIDSYKKPEYFHMAAEKGIPIVSYDTGFSGMEVPYIGIDNEQAGYNLAQYLAEEMNHEGEVGVVSGSLKQMSHRQRLDGFLAYMDTEPKIHVAFTESGYSNLQMTEKKVRKIRKKYPLVQGIMATSAVTAIGITESIPKDQVKVVSIDIQEDAVEAVRSGTISALIAQSGYEIGRQTIQYIHGILTGADKTTDKILEAELLTKQNIELYQERSQQE